MQIKKIKNKYISIITILIIGLYVFGTNQGHKFWKDDSKVIEWDVKSYYAYLPAAFIYHDLSFEFIDNNKDSVFLRNNIWPIKLDNGKYIIKTTMGMSYMYLPAFFVANIIAKPMGYKANGYSMPYKYTITIFALIYLLIGIYYLRKLLLILGFSEFAIFITLVSIVAGTNLIFYSSYEPGMSHVYNFTLINIFVYNTALWWNNKKIKNLIILGLLGGLISLIRPTNILIYILFILWGVETKKDFIQRFKIFYTEFKITILLVVLYIIPWLPQLIFWKIQTGHLLFFSYGESGEQFFFKNPQIYNILFSYWKGWFVYTPLMFIASLGIFTLYKRIKWLTVLISGFMLIVIYVLSSWWSWWFGGCYGNRAFIDFYGVMSILLASLIMIFLKNKYLKYVIVIVISLFIFHNNFQIRQYNSGAINCFSMTKEMYWEQFLKIEKTDHYKTIIKVPDNDAAHNGVYRLINENNKDSN